MIQLEALTLKQLRTDKEDTYFGLTLFFAASMWLWLIILILPILIIGLFLVIGQQLFLAHVRGNGVRISEKQFPDLHTRIINASKRLGLATPPTAYIMQAGGLLNAMATKLFSRNFIIIYSDLVDACGDDARALDFVIGHELGHIALGHLKRQLWLAPAHFVPLVPRAYSRWCEYSCDRCGLVVAGDLESASRGLGVLAAGGKLARTMSLEAFSEQAKDASGFWSSVYELNTTHPFLPKRVRAMREFMQPGTEPAHGRPFFSYPLAPFLAFGMAGPGASAFAGIFVIYMIGVMAAIAIPNFIKYQTRAKQAEAKVMLAQCATRQGAYFAEHKHYGTTFAELGLELPSPAQRYTMYMGENHVGIAAPTPDEGLVGFADADDGFTCTALANLDSDETMDVWYVNQDRHTPFHYIDDIDDSQHEEGEDDSKGVNEER